LFAQVETTIQLDLVETLASLIGDSVVLLAIHNSFLFSKLKSPFP
jgi:hypothetical protein